MTTTAPYGSWPSPLGVDELTSASVGLAEPRIDGDHLYWLESRADQAGRTSVWRAPLAGGEPVEVTPVDANVRTQVHEYGGGAYAVDGGLVAYVEFTGGQVHLVRPGAAPVALTPSGGLRYADLRLHAALGLALAVREDHRGEGEAVNTVVALDLEATDLEEGQVLCAGADFYATPELAADGRLAWVQWDHPAMPWDATAVMVGELVRGSGGRWQVGNPHQVAGGPQESAVQPRWLADGTLVFVSDRTNWWNLYALAPAGGEPRALHTTDAEFCGPQWVHGDTPYAVLDPERLICMVNRSGVESVALLDLASGDLTRLGPDGTESFGLAAGARGAAAVLGHTDRPSTLAVLDLAAAASGQPGTDPWDDRRISSTVALAPAAISVAEAVTWPAGPEAGEGGVVHGWFYPPTSPDVTAPAGSLPPLITLSHGGPTSSASASLQLSRQFWTSRGYAVLDVNYGGSTGYGRAYRQRLTGRWGLVDVADCAAGAVAMGEQGRADPARLAVRGGSAGGYTTLRAVTSTEVFAAGISEYGVADLEALALDTHKFESRYLDGLVGPYPDARELYLERSPISHLDSVAAPLLLLQGTDDKVVPPAQAERLAAAARDQGLPVALLMFDGEGHGFRRADTIRASLDAQQYFLGRLFGFTPADDVPPIEIDNLP